MYKDVINYQLADGVDEAQLIDVAEKIVHDWMKKQKGFLGWEINQNEDGSYTDIVSWESADAAKKAELAMVNIPNAGDWYACYNVESISSKKLTLKKRF